MDISKESYKAADKDDNGTLDWDEITDNEDIVDAFSKLYNQQLEEEEKAEKENNKSKRVASYIADAPGTLINDSSKNEWYYLNPVHTAINGVDADSSVTMSDAIADPLLSTATSNMKNKKAAKTIRLVLNPIGVGLGRPISGLFKK